MSGLGVEDGGDVAVVMEVTGADEAVAACEGRRVIW